MDTASDTLTDDLLTRGNSGGRERDPLPGDIRLAAVGALLVVSSGLLLRRSTIDLPLTLGMHTLDHGIAGSVASGIYAALEPLWALGLLCGLVAVVTWRQGLRSGARLGVSVTIAWLPVWVVKMLVDRPRPALPGAVHILSDPSFPSGHTAFVAILALAIFGTVTNPRLRRACATVGVLSTAIVAMSVLILGHHYPTDVLASIVWSITVMPLARRLGDTATPLLPAGPWAHDGSSTERSLPDA